MAMKQVNLFPHMVVQMTAIGEEAGALDAMLFKVAEFYEKEVNNAVDALSSLLEPMIMVIIGVVVGSMVVGMYLPIFKLAAASICIATARRTALADQVIDSSTRTPASAIPPRPASGLLLGSFLNVVILRLPRRLEWEWKRDSREVLGEPELYDPPPPGIVVERSHCPHCKHQLSWYENIPLFSWLALRGTLPPLPRADLDRSTRWSNC